MFPVTVFLERSKVPDIKDINGMHSFPPVKCQAKCKFLGSLNCVLGQFWLTTMTTPGVGPSSTESGVVQT